MAVTNTAATGQFTIDPVSPTAKAEMVSPVNGLNQSMSKCSPAGADPSATLANAMMANANNTMS